MIQGTPQKSGGAEPSKQMLQAPDVPLPLLSCNTSTADALAAGEIEEIGLKLYDNTIDPIYRFFHRKTRNKEEANDLTAETIRRMLEGLKNKAWYEQPTEGWVWGIAKYVHLEWLRRKRKQGREETLEGVSEEQTQERSLLDELLYQERGRLLWGMVDQLPEAYKNILYLFYRDDLSYKEIAKTVNKTYGACKVLRHRAIEQLRIEVKQAGMWEELGYTQGRVRDV